MLRVHSVETFGTHEGPGIRLVIFLQGCQFRCLYCHNPDTWQIGAGKETSTEEILKLAEKEKVFFRGKGGVTVSGGEPLLQRKELIELFKELKKRGFHTTLDTNGSILDEDTKELLKYTDLVLLDVKQIDPKEHLKLTNAVNTVVLEFAKYREETGKPFWLRYVLVPGYNDQDKYLHEWGKTFGSYKSVERAEILPYHTFGEYKYEKLGLEYPLKGLQTPSPANVDHAKQILSNYFSYVNVR